MEFPNVAEDSLKVASERQQGAVSDMTSQARLPLETRLIRLHNMIEDHKTAKKHNVGKHSKHAYELTPED